MSRFPGLGYRPYSWGHRHPHRGVLFTTDSCAYGDLFIARSLGDRRLGSLVQPYFNAVGLEIFNDAETVDPIMAKSSCAQTTRIH